MAIWSARFEKICSVEKTKWSTIKRYGSDGPFWAHIGGRCYNDAHVAVAVLYTSCKLMLRLRYAATQTCIAQRPPLLRQSTLHESTKFYNIHHIFFNKHILILQSSLSCMPKACRKMMLAGYRSLIKICESTGSSCCLEKVVGGAKTYDIHTKNY